MKISVIIPCYIGNVRDQRKGLDEKLIRAINSVLNQSYPIHEIIVVADGCKRVREIIDAYFSELEPIYILEIPKQTAYSGIPRNTGINMASGDVICYLDADDYFERDHLKIIAEKFDTKKYQWCFFDDLVHSDGKFFPRKCKLHHGNCGTSNIAHVRGLPDRWNDHNSYACDDWFFIKKLMKYNCQNIGQGQYCVCHIPKHYDV